MKETTKFLSDKYDEIQVELKSEKDKLSHLEHKVKSMESQMSRISSLEAKIDNMEQQARNCNIEISNLPERRGENLMTLVKELGSAMKLTITAGDVVSVHRVPHADNKNNFPKNIIVKFTSRMLRDDVLAAVRLKKGICSSDLNFDGEPRKVYINEHLTLKNKILFREARIAAKQNNYRYVWVKNGSILVRKSDNCTVFFVSSSSEIYTKIKPQ